MRTNLTRKLLLATVLLAAYAQADVLYTFSGTSTDNTSKGSTDTVGGFIDFYLVGCAANGTGCTLGIEIQNLQSPGTENFDQAITGLTFTLSGITTSVFDAGTLTATGPGGGSISTVSSTGTVGTTTGKGGWKTETSPLSTNYGTGTMALEASIDTSTAVNQIVDGASSLGGTHGTSYAGPVYFQIANITGLTTSTDVTNISVLFGLETHPGNTTLPDGFITLNTGECSALGSGVCSSGQIGSVPEPVTPLLAASGLLALAFSLRRRYLAVN